MKHISILGSTGSIGTQTLEIIRERKNIIVEAISVGKNIELAEKQIREFSPKLVSVASEEDAKELAVRIADTETKVTCGMDGLIEVATVKESQMVLTAIVGMVGILPTMHAIKAKKDIALANKETLVCAGDIIMALAEDYGVNIFPVDSEHSAILQALIGQDQGALKSIILTASGGPFFGKSLAELSGVKKEDALKHPNWDMGAKITIDSATMVNKGLEVIEACHLFNVDPDFIEVVVHRESILHSAVEFCDGAIIAQLGIPDMRVPIGFALSYPDREPIQETHLSLTDIASLSFAKPDLEVFSGLKICMEAAKIGGNRPAIINAANEIAVEAFLNDKIEFLDIPELMKKAEGLIPYIKTPRAEEIMDIYPTLKEILL